MSWTQETDYSYCLEPGSCTHLWVPVCVNISGIPVAESRFLHSLILPFCLKQSITTKRDIKKSHLGGTAKLVIKSVNEAKIKTGGTSKRSITLKRKNWPWKKVINRWQMHKWTLLLQSFSNCPSVQDFMRYAHNFSIFVQQPFFIDSVQIIFDDYIKNWNMEQHIT